jgi:hypothetical protein
MLVDLDTIDWTQLDTAYGPATTVPVLLRNLTSSDSQTRQHAMYDLWQLICHQGSVWWSASASAAPFLIELLSYPQLADKPAILHLLAALTHGGSSSDVHYALDPAACERMAARRRWMRITREAVASGVDVYLDLLIHPDPEIRTYAAYILAFLPERSAQIAPHLRARFTTEAQFAVQTSLLLALRAHACQPDADPSVFTTVLQANSCDIQTFLAAVALIETLREQTPDEVVDRLIHFSHLIRTDPAWLDHLYSDDVWSVEAGFVPSPWGLDLAELVTDALVKLSSERCLRAFLNALRGIQVTGVAHEFAERLLEVAFGRPQVRWSGPAIFPTAAGGTKRLYRLRISVPAYVRTALS